MRCPRQTMGGRESKQSLVTSQWSRLFSPLPTMCNIESLGPLDISHSAVLNRGNITGAASVLHLLSADDVTLDHLEIRYAGNRYSPGRSDGLRHATQIFESRLERFMTVSG